MKPVAVFLLLAAVGCSRAEPSAAKSAAQRTSGSETTTATLAEGELPACCSRCPLALPGVTLKYAQTTAGGSMLFNAPDTELEELRARVRELAAYHNEQNHTLAMITLPHDAEAVAIDGGAQLRLTTPINNDVQLLQQEVENEVQWMQGGRCPGNLAQTDCVCQLGRVTPLPSAQSSESPVTPSTRPSR